MKKLFYGISCVLFSIIFFTSCTKQDAVTTPVQPTVDTQFKLSNVKFENGMLVFNTKADMDSALILINKVKDVDVSWIYKQFPQHVSHNMVFNSLSKEELNLIDSSSSIPDKYKNIVKFAEFDSSRILIESISIYPFSIFANKDGFWGVGNDVVKIGSNYTYSIKKDFYLANLNLDFTKVTSSNENIKVNAVINNPSVFRTSQQLGTTQSLYQGARRIAIYLWTSDAILYFYNPQTNTYYPGKYQQTDLWGQYENFGCNGLFCHSTWRPDWCYSMKLIGYIYFKSNNSKPPYSFPVFQSQGQGTGKIYYRYAYAFIDTDYSVDTASIQLDIYDGNNNFQSLSFMY